MSQELGMSQDLIDRIFPELDELIDIHMGFIQQLLERQGIRADRSFDFLGDLLLNQVSLKPVLHGYVFHDRFSLSCFPWRAARVEYQRVFHGVRPAKRSNWERTPGKQDARASETRHVFHVAILHGRVSSWKTWHC